MSRRLVLGGVLSLLGIALVVLLLTKVVSVPGCGGDEPPPAPICVADKECNAACPQGTDPDCKKTGGKDPGDNGKGKKKPPKAEEITILDDEDEVGDEPAEFRRVITGSVKGGAQVEVDFGVTQVDPTAPPAASSTP